jgi:ribosomal protein S12 methylthiotransferase
MPPRVRPHQAERSGARSPRVGFVSLGCPKALVDSEQIVTQLKAEGYAIAPTYAGADLVVVNTCGFIDAAVSESLDAIGEALAKNGKVIVTGCLGAKDGGTFIRDAHPTVLAVTGPHATAEVMAAVHAHLPKLHDPFADLVPPQGIKLTPQHYAYLKISEGCNHRCTFCIIPSMRGDLVSRPIGEVLAEAERLLQAGVKELLVISQDTSAYGVDVKYRTGFWQGRPLKTRMVELATSLDAMARAHGAWVRLHYVYPYPHVDDVIERMTSDPARGGLLPYLDVPFQHASPRILKLMKRPANAEGTLRRIEAWRAARPDLVIRSTFIAGFPGETEAEFAELLAFLDAAQLDRVGCFAYSPVDGAAANALPGRVPDEAKEDRRARFMAAQAKISAARLARRVGDSLTVLVDGHDGKTAIARSAADAPEIDGTVRIANAKALAPGAFARVTVVGSSEHDLVARLGS